MSMQALYQLAKLSCKNEELVKMLQTEEHYVNAVIVEAEKIHAENLKLLNTIADLQNELLVVHKELRELKPNMKQ